MSTGPQDPYNPQPPADGPSSGGYDAPGGGYGAPGGGYNAPPPPPAYGGGNAYGGGTEKNNLGVWALVLGILGIVCCGFFAGIPAIILGNKAKEAAAQGLANNGGMGQAGVVLGWIAIVLGILGVIWAVAMGGFAAITEGTYTGY